MSYKKILFLIVITSSWVLFLIVFNNYQYSKNIFYETASDGVYMVDYYNQTYIGCSENEVFFGYCNPDTELIGTWITISGTFNDGLGYYKVVVIDNIIVYTVKMGDYK